MLYVMSWAGENGHQTYSTSSVAVSGWNTKFLGAAFSAEPAAPLQLLLLLKHMLNSYQDIGVLEYNAYVNIKKYNCKTWYTQQDLIQNTTEANKIRYSTDSGHISTIQHSEPDWESQRACWVSFIQLVMNQVCKQKASQTSCRVLVLCAVEQSSYTSTRTWIRVCRVSVEYQRLSSFISIKIQFNTV